MDTPVIVALIGGWSTIIVSIVDVRRRVNGPITAQFKELKEEFIDLKDDLRDVKADVRELKHKVCGGKNESN